MENNNTDNTDDFGYTPMFKVFYSDPDDTLLQDVRIRAYDEIHAREKFHESFNFAHPEMDFVEILSIERVA